MNQGEKIHNLQRAGVVYVLLAHPWFKTFSISVFMTVFFAGYFYLLRHPAFPVHSIPATALDDAIAFQPAALPIYLSLWAYVSLPPALMTTNNAIVAYGFRIAALCLAGFTVFYFWPNAITPSVIDWNNHP
ncbi:MAG TPA: hypothetical protein VLC91_05760, partial [Spongiibacteraceae bacterium]|nr:hypothetical protein [Spongiibacteraceae bacterium]